MVTNSGIAPRRSGRIAKQQPVPSEPSTKRVFHDRETAALPSKRQRQIKQHRDNLEQVSKTPQNKHQRKTAKRSLDELEATPPSPKRQKQRQRPSDPIESRSLQGIIKSTPHKQRQAPIDSTARWRGEGIANPSQKQEQEQEDCANGEVTASRPRATERGQQAPTSAPIDPIDHWRREGYWPDTFFEYHTMDQMYVLPKLPGAPSRKRSIGGSVQSSINSDFTDGKSSAYCTSQYDSLLALKGFYLHTDPEGPSASSRKVCVDLLKTKTSVPSNTIFEDHIFENACIALQNQNESRITRDLAELIVPSPSKLAWFGELDNILAETVNQGWNASIPITHPRPQPDFSVGFRETAFTAQQRAKLAPAIGDGFSEQSRFRSAHGILFPFLSCEIKSGLGVLEVANRQNAHSMGIAARAVVDLYRLAKREKEIDRQILAFSISHSDQFVMIFGYYPVITGETIQYYRHKISSFDFQDNEGRDRWKSYKFVKGVYKKWAVNHLKALQKVIDELPDDIAPLIKPKTQSNPQSQPPASEHTGLSQQVDQNHISEAEAASVVDTQASSLPQQLTPETLLSESAKQAPKSKRRQSGRSGKS